MEGLVTPGGLNPPFLDFGVFGGRTEIVKSDFLLTAAVKSFCVVAWRS